MYSESDRMEILKIKGGKTLSGTIEIGGAKNSAVALVPAAILSDHVVIENVPEISDVRALEEIINYLGGEYYKEGKKVTINAKKLRNTPITAEHCKKLRASYYFMGALLGRYKKAEMYFPGGCTIGKRPIDFHLKAFEKLGAKVTIDGDKYTIKADKLKGAEITFPFASVGATINVLLAATKAEGITKINNAAKEPEVANVIDLLNSMGAKISGKDTNTITIEGVKKLTGGIVKVIPDRIEAGTYIILGAMVGKNLVIDKINKNHLTSLLETLKEMNVPLKIEKDKITVSKKETLNKVKVKTEVYPGFPTDLQQPLTPLLTKAQGESQIEETIYENRFKNVKYLNQMGANIKEEETKIIIKGKTTFHNEKVKATDLRAGASLIIAALEAEGETTIEDVKYVLRGYENIIKKLTQVGAEISLEYV